MNIGSVTKFPIPTGNTTEAAKPPPAKVHRDHDRDNDAAESKASAADAASKSQSRLDITA